MLKFPNELYYGNIEYKLHLVNISDERIYRYSTQLNFRINEGNGKAYYLIGIYDNGSIKGLDIQEIKESIYNMLRIKNVLNQKIYLYSKPYILNNGKYLCLIKLDDITYINRKNNQFLL